jgi:hypothetical protein
MQEGWSWTYRLEVTRGDETNRIEYTTAVARAEDVDGKPCTVFENRSDQRLLKVEWFHQTGERIHSVQTQNGANAAIHTFVGRVVLDWSQLADAAAGVSWDWTGSDGSNGTITYQGRETVRVRGTDMECLKLEDTGEFHAGSRRATQVRTLWLAPGLGMVKEHSTIHVGDRLLMETQATLLRHESP